MLVPLPWGTIWQYLIHKPHDSVIPFLDIHFRESLAHVFKEASKRVLVSALFAKSRKKPSFTGELEHKLQFIHKLEYYTGVKEIRTI